MAATATQGGAGNMATAFQHICNTINPPLSVEIPGAKVDPWIKTTFQIEKFSHNEAVLRIGSLNKYRRITSTDFERAVQWLQNPSNANDPLIRYSTRGPNLTYLDSLFPRSSWEQHHASYIASILDEVAVVKLYRDRKTGIRIRLLSPWKTSSSAKASSGQPGPR